MTSKYAAAYLRRSFASAESPGDASREAQEAAVRSMCGPEVTIYADWGISGRRADRPDYQRLRADIEADKVSSVCAYSLSRLGRNAKELLDFVELAGKHGVTVRTKVENIDTSSAMGRAMLTVMAAFAQLEAESGMERSAAAREARYVKAEAAGALLPGKKLTGSVPAYGFRHVKGPDDVIRREPDPKRPIEPIIAAYREAGTVRGACELLQERGIPAPEGGRVWGSSTLARILHSHIPDEMPDRNASGHKRAMGKAALFAGLLRCHCGRTLTPNVARGQYYCAGGRDSGPAAHGGKYSVTEKALTAALWSEVARQYRAGPKPIFRERNTQAITDLQARRERVGAAVVDGFISPSKAKTETEIIDQKLEKLQRQAGAWSGMFASTAPLDLNGDPRGQNTLLRALWLRVQLDRDMRPSVHWIIDPDQLRADEEAAEAAYNAPGPDGESRREWEAGQP